MNNIFERIGKTASAAAGKVSGAVWEKVEDVNDQMDAIERSKFLSKICEDEKCSLDDASLMCTVHSPKWEPKYSLGYKMASPSVMAMLAMKKGKEAFKRGLEPEELILFEDEIEHMDVGKAMVEEFKKQKKAKKAAKKAAKQRAFGLEVKSSKKQEGKKE